MAKAARPRPATATEGQLSAASALGRTIMHPDVTGVIDDYKRLATREARMAFADHFLGRTAGMMDEIWPAFYELLKLVEEDELYLKPGYLAGDRTFASFEEYFEYRAGRPFATWSELESTYHYAQKYAPDLLKRTFAVARNAKERITQGGQALAQAIKDEVLAINSGGGPLTEKDKANPDIIRVSDGVAYGTNAAYLMRRIARDHPDILERACAGEFPSARAAALEAGIAPRTQSVRTDDPESAARTLRKHMPREALLRLAELLTKEDK